MPKSSMKILLSTTMKLYYRSLYYIPKKQKTHDPTLQTQIY